MGLRWCLLAMLVGCGRIAFGDLADAGTTGDSSVTDTGPTGPLLVSGQAADLVIGQPDLMSGTPGTVDATSLQSPAGIAITGTQMWIHDNDRSRILMWSPVPTTIGEPATLVLGQTDLTATANGPTSQTRFLATDDIAEYDGMATDGQRLYVANHEAARVMVWEPLPTMNLAPMQRVLGNDNFTGTQSSNPASLFGDPTGIWTDGSRLVIADIHGHRVMIWPTVPAVNAEPASVVIGRDDFVYSETVAPPSAGTLRQPHGVHVAGGKLFVADTDNHRVLVWNQVPTSNGVPADFVIGQPDMTSGAENADGGPTAASLNAPVGVITHGDNLIIADRANHRVLVYSPIPTATGASASIVLGQPSFTSATPGVGPDRLQSPVYLATTATHLWVSDNENNRVVGFRFAN